MSILIDKKTKLIVQGITGRDGSLHTSMMKEYGVNVVAGVTPGKGGITHEGTPVFNTVVEALEKTKANTSVIYVPPAFAVDSIYEAADAGIKLIVCITEGIPANDMMKAAPYVKEKGARLLGPNCPGLISPGLCKVGIIPGQICKKGDIGVVSRSGTLTYEAIWALTADGIGQSTCVGIGGDQVAGTGFIDCLEMFENDPGTKAVVLIGEIGGSDEQEAAKFVKRNMSKPVVGFISGRTAPPGKRMGHAGAIIAGDAGTAQAKLDAFAKAGIPVANSPTEFPALIKEALAGSKNGARKATSSKKTVTKKTSEKKTVARKTATKKTAAKKLTTKKTAKTAAKKKTARK